MKVSPLKWEKTNIFEKSLFLNLINRLTKWIYAMIINGFFGRIFTAYSRAEEKFQKSAITTLFKKRNNTDNRIKKVRLEITKCFEESLFVTSVASFFSSLLRLRLKEYGVLFAVSGAVGILIKPLKGESLTSDLSSTVTLSFFIVLGTLFFFSEKAFSEAVCESIVLKPFVLNRLGLPMDSLSAETPKSGVYYLSVMFGLFSGGITYFVNPLSLVIVAIVGGTVATVFAFPEIGILVLISVIPIVGFLSKPSLILLGLVCVTAVSYAVKLIRGKRIIKFSLLDFSVLVFLFVRLTSGMFSAGGLRSLAQVSLVCGLMLAYFLTVNLINSKEWLKRTVLAIVSSSTVAVSVGIFQFFTGGFENGWLDLSLFSGISVRIGSTFENPNIFGVYLLLVIPFVVGEIVSNRKGKKLIAVSLLLPLLVFCVVQTWSRGAWLGFVLSVVSFLLILSRKTLPYIVLGGGAIAIGILMFTPNVYGRILSISNLSESSVSYRISAWKGIFEMLRQNWLCGIGYGEAAFSAVYPAFAYSGTLAVKHAHSLYLQIVTESGVVGLLAFFAVIIFFAQCCLEYLKTAKPSSEKNVVIAGVSAVSGTLLMGLTDYIWYSPRVFLCFWLVIAVAIAGVRIGTSESEMLKGDNNDSLYSADIELITRNR